MRSGFLALLVALGCSPSVEIAGGGDSAAASAGSAGAAIGSWSLGVPASDQGNVVGTGVAIDGQGNIVVVGVLQGQADFGGGPLQGENGSPYVAKYSPSGKHLWSKVYIDTSLGGAGSPRVALDTAGDIVVTGSFDDSIDFGGTVLTSGISPSPFGMDSGFIVVVTPNGDFVYAIQFGGPEDCDPESIALASNGDVLIAGYSGPHEFYYGGGVPVEGANVFLLRVGPMGQYVFSKAFVTANAVGDEYVALDGAGDIVLGASVDASIDFGGGPVAGDGIALAKLDASGTFLSQAKFIGASLSQAKFTGDGPSLSGFAVDSAGRALLAGYEYDDFDFGGLSGPGAFLASVDETGAYIFAKSLGTHATGFGVATDAASNVVITGGFGGSIDFGAGPITTPALDWSVCVAKYTATGDLLWGKGFGASSGSFSGNGNAVALAADGSPVITGGYIQSLDFGEGPLPNSSPGAGMFLAKLPP